MYQKISYAVAAVLFGIMLTGCTTYSYTSRSAAIRATSIESSAMGARVDADFSRTVTATSRPQKTKSAAMNEAQFLCLQEAKIDVIVDPIYRIEYRMLKRNPYTVTVVGFAGHFTQVATGFDAFLEKNYSKEDIEKYLLLNDPSFLPYYYQQKGIVEDGDVTNYFINSNQPAPVVKRKAAPASTSSVVVPTSANKSKSKTKSSFMDLFNKK